MYSRALDSHHLISEDEDDRTQHNKTLGKLEREYGQDERNILKRIFNQINEIKHQVIEAATSAKPNMPTRERAA